LIIRRLFRGVLAAVPLFSMVQPASAAVGDAWTVSARSSGDVAYWTADRMRTATPLDVRDQVAGPDAGLPMARPTSGSKVVGALFFDDGAGSHYCTASVVDSPKKDLLLTAAHCLYDPDTGSWHGHIVFVPKYSRGHRPYGTWPVWLMVTDKRWTDGGDPDVDFGFAAVQEIGGKRIADVVGANQLLVDQGYTNRVRVIGYPAKVSYPSDRPVACDVLTHRLADRQVRFDCGGFYGGTSGSPLIKGYDRGSESGYVVGVIGGYHLGGSYDWRSYSTVFGSDIAHLMVTADQQA
jgi:V8-like Glu-specific endopeptidase